MIVLKPSGFPLLAPVWVLPTGNWRIVSGSRGALRLPSRRVAGRRYRLQALSERHKQVSLHAAQAFLTPLAGRGFDTVNPWR